MDYSEYIIQLFSGYNKISGGKIENAPILFPNGS